MASLYKSMGECARMWFQLARGRAIVQKNYMAKARAYKRADQERAAQGLPVASLVPFFVKFARRAFRDWRRYRSHYLECRKDGI